MPGSDLGMRQRAIADPAFRYELFGSPTSLTQIKQTNPSKITGRHANFIYWVRRLRTMLKPSITRLAILHAKWNDEPRHKSVEYILTCRALDYRAEDIEVSVIVEPMGPGRIAASRRPTGLGIVDRR